MTTYTNKTVECLTCEQGFLWTAKQQELFAERDWDPPLRCPKCRELMRRKREGAAGFSARDEAEGARSVNAFEQFDRRRR